MRNTKYILLLTLCLTAGLVLLSGIGEGTFTKISIAQTSPTTRSFTQTKPMPPELMYLVLFHELNTLKQKDSQSQAQGQTTSFKVSFYTDRLNLQASQISAVDNIVADCLAQVRPVEQRARDVINQYRSQYPNGVMRSKQTTPSSDGLGSARPQSPVESLPTPPAELVQLQAQKNQIILAAKDKIRQSLGDSAFANFDSAVQQNSTRILVPLGLGAHQPVPMSTPGN